MQLFQNSFSSKANVHDSFSNIAPDITFCDYYDYFVIFPKGNCISKRMHLGPNNDNSKKKNPYE